MNSIHAKWNNAHIISVLGTCMCNSVWNMEYVGFTAVLLEIVPCVCGCSQKDTQWCHQLEWPSEIHPKPGDEKRERERERERERVSERHLKHTHEEIYIRTSLMRSCSIPGWNRTGFVSETNFLFTIATCFPLSAMLCCVSLASPPAPPAISPLFPSTIVLRRKKQRARRRREL